MSAAQSRFSTPRGMRDFYPPDMAVRDALFDTWRQASRQHGFLPYDAPVVESLDLLKRKSGEEIVDQIYAFEDKSGRQLALRPEMTPTLARLIAAREGELTFPIKWYTIAQCFRYERMTRGRRREHYQWNLDIIGERDVSAEAEVLATAVAGLELAGLSRTDFTVRYNSRRLLGELLDASDIAPAHHTTAFLALDKRGKISDDELAALLQNASLSTEQCAGIFALLDTGSLDDARRLLPADSPALSELDSFARMLSAYGLTDVVQFDIGVIRGLGYYTGIVFEAFDRSRSSRAIFGGGRYDNLLRDVGGREQTGVGLGFGDVVITDLLDELGRRPTSGAAPQVAIGYMESGQQRAAIQLAGQLRREGRQVDLALHPEKPKAFFSRVNKQAIAAAAYIGPDDLARGSVRVKDMGTRAETERPLTV
ncbi:MAG: histidine--tRNA ligase [Verrucomicrobia bacterium]|nr:histidine--tRNA ligase [Verrucomicrobiota bacterium]